MTEPNSKPVVGITPDIYLRQIGPADARSVMPTWRVAQTYARCVSAAGGVPIVLSPMAARGGALAIVDAVVMTGGDDPIMEEYGVETHRAAVRVVPERQAFERELLACAADDPRDLPVLGVCLGMQYMTLAAGARSTSTCPRRSRRRRTTGSGIIGWRALTTRGRSGTG